MRAWISPRLARISTSSMWPLVLAAALVAGWYGPSTSVQTAPADTVEVAAYGYSLSPAVAASNARGAQDIFITSRSGHVYQLLSTGWHDLGAPGGVLAKSSPTATWRADGARIDVFVTGRDNVLYQRYWNNPGGWSDNWIRFRDGISQAPSASWSSESMDRLDVVAQGAGGGLWHYRWTADEGWKNALLVPPPPGFGSNPSLAWDDQEVETLAVYVTGADNALWFRLYNLFAAWWSPWTKLASVLGSGPGVASTRNARNDVFARGTDGSLYQACDCNGVDGTWYLWDGVPWAGFPGPAGGMTSSPAAAWIRDTYLSVFAVSGNGGLYGKYFMSSTGWSGWERRATVPA